AAQRMGRRANGFECGFGLPDRHIESSDLNLMYVKASSRLRNGDSEPAVCGARGATRPTNLGLRRDDVVCLQSATTDLKCGEANLRLGRIIQTKRSFANFWHGLAFQAQRKLFA